MAYRVLIPETGKVNDLTDECSILTGGEKPFDQFFQIFESIIDSKQAHLCRRQPMTFVGRAYMDQEIIS